jgi:energy-coupling factor transporter ATP-binding protein EcfA2
MTDDILRTTDLTKRFGALTANDGISLSVERGEIRGIIGPNGSGKSTFLKTLNGIVPVWDGTITYGDVDLTETKPEDIVTHGIATLPQGGGIRFSEAGPDDRCVTPRQPFQRSFNRLMGEVVEFGVSSGRQQGRSRDRHQCGAQRIHRQRIGTGDRRRVRRIPIPTDRRTDPLDSSRTGRDQRQSW